MPSRRQALFLPFAAMALHATGVRAQQTVPIADMHTHYGLISRRLETSGLAEEMRAQKVAFIAWKAIPDSPWLRLTPSGVEPASVPQPGALAATLDRHLASIRAYIEAHQLVMILKAADVDRCVDGNPGVLISTEGADFLEGDIARLGPAYDRGLRLLQLVHYIPTPVGDRQTAAPTHAGLSDLGKAVVEQCNRRGMLLDLAHCSGEAVDQALAASSKPMIWSHGWIDQGGGRWNDRYGFLQRRLSLEHGRKIAAAGGVIGVWALGLQHPGGSLMRSRGAWTVGRRDTEAYAKELLYTAEQVGPDHVAIGTDIEGLGPDWSVNDYAGVRQVVQHLERLKAPQETIEKLAYRNFARVLKANLST